MKTRIFFLLIIILAFFLRCYKLSYFPATLYGDEQAFAWNAYNILKTGEDEYGTSFPLQFKSFDDYKAPIPVYLLVPFIKFLGLNSFATRLPVALVSIFTVSVTYFLAKLFFRERVSLLMTFLMAISPWHVHLSRGFFEATLALFWFILGVYFFLRSNGRLKLLLMSMTFFAFALYSYFTPRILVPIFLIFLIWYDLKHFVHLKRNIADSSTCQESIQPPGRCIWRRGVFKIYLLSLLFLAFLSLPLIKLTFFDKGFSRFEKLLETNKYIVEQTVNRERNASNLPIFWRTVFHNKATVWLRILKNNYLEHLSPNFWYIFGDNSLRYFVGNMGMFYLAEFPFLIIGLYFLWKENRRAAVFFLSWILIAPIPASLAGRSFAVRSLAILPAPFAFVGYGIYRSSLFFQSPSKSRQAPPSRWPPPAGGLEGMYWKFPLLLTLGYIFSLSSLLIRYYLEYPVYAATWWGWENKAAIDYAKGKEKEFDRIFISDFYTGITLAFAVYNQYDPIEYRYAVNHPVVLADGRHLIKLGKYYFGSLDIDKKRLKQGIIPPRSLYIARPEEADSDETINAPDDGRIIFKVHRQEMLR